MATVPAGVGEGAQGTGLIADQQHALHADPDRSLVARLPEVGDSAHAHPRAFEEVLLLPREHLGRGVGGGGQRAGLLGKPRQAAPQGGGIQRRVPHPCPPASGARSG